MNIANLASNIIRSTQETWKEIKEEITTPILRDPYIPPFTQILIKVTENCKKPN